MASRLAFTRYGEPGKPVVLLLHGFMGAAADWSEVAAGLGRAYQSLAVDLPGHGRSVRLGTPAAYTIASVAGELAALLDDQGIDRCIVVGYSMGGRLALYFALHHAARCSRLVLESATPGIRREADRAVRREIDEARAVRLERGAFETFLEEWYRQPLFETLRQHEGLVERMIAARKQNDPFELARALRGLGRGQQASLWERMERLQVPTLAVAGALDGKYAELAEAMAVRTDRVRVALLPNAGHNVHAENPKAFIELLKNFFKPV
jgi:2-succinyl-6-hydroxy-2,4-cyclohexadiene-1-carboxylate synthase